MSTADEFLQQAVDFHLQYPDISPGEHLRARELELGSWVAGRKKIFLDTRYWLLLRDHVRGVRRNVHLERLYQALRTLRQLDQGVCPTGISVVAEVLKQEDRESARRTAQLMDELGASVVIQPELRRVRREVKSFVTSGLLDRGARYPLTQLVWTRPSWLVVGDDPSVEEWPPHQRRAAAKAWIDFRWEITVTDYVEAYYEYWTNIPAYKAFHDHLPEVSATRLNADKSTMKVPAFHKHFLGHLEVPLHHHRHDIEDVLDVMFESELGTSAPVEEVRASRDQGPVTEWIRSAFRDDLVGTALPYFRVLPAILAAIDRDKPRRFKRNDLADLYHAASALPYCDVYLTEGSFKHLLVSKPLAFDRLYDTRVVSDPGEAADLCESFIQPSRGDADPLV